MPRFCLIFYNPKGSSQKILRELFSAFPDVVGKIGLYRGCGFVSGGTGQFIPQEGADPTLGQVGEPSFVDEERVEVIVNDNEDKSELREVVQKLKQVRIVLQLVNVHSDRPKVHEYEEVAYHVFRLEEGI